MRMQLDGLDFAAFLDEELVDSMSSASPPCIKRRKLLCAHNGGVCGGMCLDCGKNIDDTTSIVLGYIHKDLILGKDAMMRLRNAECRKMLQKRKLCLVLDLDHTLLNTTHLKDISPDEEYLMNQPHYIHDGSLFRLDHMGMVTKLRPFVRKFLKEASDLFEMYIYTMGNKTYANEMANLLDPEGSYFCSRIISREDSTRKHQKGLDVILTMDRAVVVLDDKEAVWQKHKENVIVMERYHFFQRSRRSFGLAGKSLCELKMDEGEEDGLLATMLGVLRRVHSSFFEREREREDAIAFAATDVREILKTMKEEVLKGCKIVFSDMIPCMYWKMAEELGATCCEEVDSSVTHVASLHPGTDESNWASNNNKLLVHPNWIHAAFHLWKRLPEDSFPVIDHKMHH